MPDKYIVNMTEKTTPEDTNLLVIEDSQDTKRTTLANLKTAILASHLAESTSKHITESGSNVNGRYIKFDDGTMMCTRTEIITVDDVDSISSHGALWRAMLNSYLFPATFTSINFATFQIAEGNWVAMRNFAFPGKIMYGTAVPLSLTHWHQLVAWSPNEFNYNQDGSVKILFFAIGRWK